MARTPRAAKKAKTLMDLDSLAISNRTKNYLLGTFGSIDEVIREGRIDAYEEELGTRSLGKAPKWRAELIPALRRAGFIRPMADFVITFNVGALYKFVYERWGDSFITSIDQLSNEEYEKFKGLSDEEITAVKTVLRERLKDREYDLILRRFGLDGDYSRGGLVGIGRQIGVTGERARQIEFQAFRRLVHPGTKLPAIFDAPRSLEKAAEDLYAELKELYQSPAFKRADVINRELERMEKSPFRYHSEVLKAGTMDDTVIEELQLNVRTYNCLRRAGLMTIADIINYPKGDWLKIRNLGRKSLKDLVETMHLVGYTDFRVDLLA